MDSDRPKSSRPVKLSEKVVLKITKSSQKVNKKVGLQNRQSTGYYKRGKKIKYHYVHIYILFTNWIVSLL
jgi:hypothetical protein